MSDTPRSLPPRVSANERLPAGHPILFEECLVADSLRAAPERFSGALPTKAKKRRYWLMMIGLAVLAIAITAATLAWKSPVPMSHPGFWAISKLRASTLVIIAVVAFAQSTATIAFQTVTNNRILTPSIMGFESLYRLVQTAAVFFLGASGTAALTGAVPFLAQVAIMTAMSGLLYGWLLGGFGGKRDVSGHDLQITLLIGLVLGGGLGALSTFMQRLLTPSEFDVLTARLIGSIANADARYLPYVLPLMVLAGGGLWFISRKLNLMALGREAAVNLGLDHKRLLIGSLLMIAVLMAISTALVGPMTFFGFLTAMITYQLADTFDHRLLFPMGVLVGYVILAGSHFVLKNLFYAEGSVGIIMEVVGGTFFLVYILRKGRL